MRWEEWVLGTSALWFLYTLLGSCRSPQTRIPRATSGQNIALSLSIGSAHASLGMWFPALTNVAILAAWVFLFRCRATGPTKAVE